MNERLFQISNSLKMSIVLQIFLELISWRGEGGHLSLERELKQDFVVACLGRPP